MSEGAAPLILTAQLPRDLHSFYTQLRKEHFPPERNYLQAHVTMFHALPALCEGELDALCRRLAGEFAPVTAQVEGIMSLGNGTAIRLSSVGMLTLRAMIADRFHGMLTGQDQHEPRLHVTIQNKVTSAAAKRLQAQLAQRIETQCFAFSGLTLFRYRGGPWEAVASYPFRGRARP